MKDKQRYSEEEILSALAEASKLYDRYIRLRELTSLSDSWTVEENYDRDMNHPLSIVVREGKNALVE